MLKKTTLLAMAVSALVALAAPAIAQADEWYTHVGGSDVTVGTTRATGDTVEFTGELASTKFPVRNGPCVVHAKVTVWNGAAGNTATAEVESLTITATAGSPCQVFIFNEGAEGYVPVAGCALTEATSANFPWHVDVLAETKIDITGANFTNTYSGCAALGIPNGTKLGASGTATGTWVNNATGGCIEFNEDGDMKDAGGNSVLLDGSVCKTNLTLK